LFADSLVNYSIVALFATLSMGRPFFTVIRTMRFGSPSTFVPTYVAFGFLGVLIAEMYLRLGFVAIVGFLAPVFIVRQMFLYGHRLESVTRALASRNNALRRVDERIAEERRDERSRIAAALHDDVLQSLYGVTLRAQVIKEDLRTGRLLDLDADLPDLLHAGETAVEGLRDVIRDLRRSTIGHAGLIDTLTLLIEHLQGESGIRFVPSLDIGCRADADVELGIYQIAREALTNAVRHSQADSIQVSLKQDESDIVLVVEDDGTGFSPASQHDERHFGLELMKERARVLGGVVELRSSLGFGTIVTARLGRKSTG
jgi:signal transduction histidine kinase